MAKALLIESTSDRDVQSEPEYSPHTYEDNVTVTDESQEVSRESSQQSVTHYQYESDPGPAPSYMHRRIVY